ncbi:MAG: AMP-binding protein [Alphaproteobacteria bacterium]|nr:AMP-binding protein [Alphaproteobacteria bacterium]
MAEGAHRPSPQDVKAAPFKKLPQLPPDVSVDRRADGTVYLWANQKPGDRPRSIAHLLDQRASEHPERPYMRQRLPSAPGAPLGPWRQVTYAEAKTTTDALAQALLALGLGPDAPLMILSGNSIEHGLLTLAAMKARAPVAPMSVPYSLMSSDHGKIRHAFRLVRPRAVFVQQVAPFAKAIAALEDEHGGPLPIITAEPAPPTGALAYADLARTAVTPAVAASMESITDATVAKYLFTSGSTGMPKGVPQTQGMLCSLISGQEGLRAEARDPNDPPEMLDWMPWNHISGANVNWHANLWSGGIHYIDDGKPLPGMFETTIQNLYEVSPIVFGSAPIAFAMLADAMEKDPKLRASFFKKLRYMGYGGATLSDDLYDRLQALAVAETGHRIPLTTMYGATETQGITVVHWEAERVGLIGLPLPGMVLKLVPSGSKLEVRVKGPTVTSGYHADPEKTAAAFDEEGFYKLGDACRFVDPQDPSQGLIFDGRVTEDFKLSSGTWVSVGTLRPDIVAACSPWVLDAVIVGQDKPYIGALIWPSAAAMKMLEAEASDVPAPVRLAARIKAGIEAHNAGAGGSSRRIARFKILTEPPSVDAGEITDKGYVNQRLTLDRRKADADALYAEPAPAGVVVA